MLTMVTLCCTFLSLHAIQFCVLSTLYFHSIATSFPKSGVLSSMCSNISCWDETMVTNVEDCVNVLISATNEKTSGVGSTKLTKNVSGGCYVKLRMSKKWGNGWGRQKVVTGINESVRISWYEIFFLANKVNKDIGFESKLAWYQPCMNAMNGA